MTINQLHYKLTSEVQCSYQLINQWSSDTGRMAEYTREISIGEYSYRAKPSCKLVSPGLIGISSHWELLRETTPFAHVGHRLAWKYRALSFLRSRRHFKGAVCCLLDIHQYDGSYFHWLFDTLPRALAALDYQLRTGLNVKLLVPFKMLQWQKYSLLYLGLSSANFVPINRSDISTSISADTLIAAPSCRVQGLANTPYDCICPGIVRQLADKLIKNSGALSDAPIKCNRIYITREDASSRKIINESAVREKLSAKGFQIITLAGMPFAKQIQLFYSASNIIGVHGAGLSNLLFSHGASLLEIFSAGHGIRPDYFQLASIRSVSYFHYVCASINHNNDIYLDLAVLDDYIALTC